MNFTRVERRGGMSCAGSSSRVGVVDRSLGLGSSSSTYSFKGELEKGSTISSGWTEKFIGESGAVT